MTDWKQETKPIEAELHKLRNLGLADRQPRLSDEQIRFALAFHGKLVEKMAQLESEIEELRQDKARLDWLLNHKNFAGTLVVKYAFDKAWDETVSIANRFEIDSAMEATSDE